MLLRKVEMFRAQKLQTTVKLSCCESVRRLIPRFISCIFLLTLNTLDLCLDWKGLLTSFFPIALFPGMLNVSSRYHTSIIAVSFAYNNLGEKHRMVEEHRKKA